MTYNSKKDSAIETLGAIGAALSVFCLIQVMIFAKRTDWFVITLIINFLISTVAFILFFKQKAVYIILLGIAGGLSLITTSYAVLNGLLSPLFIILLIMTLVTLMLSFENKYLEYIKKVEEYKSGNI